jgi:hypothetical protein
MQMETVMAQSAVMHDAVIKLYAHSSNAGHHHF